MVLACTSSSQATHGTQPRVAAAHPSAARGPVPVPAPPMFQAPVATAPQEDSAGPVPIARGPGAAPRPTQPTGGRSVPVPSPVAVDDAGGSSSESDDSPGTGTGNNDAVESAPCTDTVTPLPRRGRWSREEEMLLMNAWGEYEAAALEAETRKTVRVESSSSEVDARRGKVREFKKQRVNVSQEAFKRDSERLEWIL